MKYNVWYSMCIYSILIADSLLYTVLKIMCYLYIIIIYVIMYAIRSIYAM